MMQPMEETLTEPLDRIHLRGLRARGHHGVLPAERELGQEFSADLTLHLDTRAAGASDELAATVSYADVAEDVVALLAGEPVDLLETLADRIATAVLGRPGVQQVDVTVHKPHAPIPVPFDDVTVTVTRSTPRSGGQPAAQAPGLQAAAAGTARQAVLALGGNLGDVPATLRAAVHALGRHPHIDVTAVSPLAQTAAHLQPGQPAQPDYHNAVVLTSTALPPRELLAVCQGIELAMGRVREERWGARTLDIDLVAIGDLAWHDEALQLPHPRAHERTFVLAPWHRIDPEARLAGYGRIADLLASDGVQRPEHPGALRWVGQWDGNAWHLARSAPPEAGRG